jgi:predicted RNase H-like HicB family nuclease
MIYDVLLTKKDDKFVARVCQWPATVAESDTEEEALRKVQVHIQSLLARRLSEN